MHADRHAVSGEPNVHLNAIGAAVQSGHNRGHGVLWRPAFADLASVSQQMHAVMVEPGGDRRLEIT